MKKNSDAQAADGISSMKYVEGNLKINSIT